MVMAPVGWGPRVQVMVAGQRSGGSAAVGAPAIPSLHNTLPRICSLLPRADITPLSLPAPNVPSIREVLAAGPCPTHTGFSWVLLSQLDLPCPCLFWGPPSPLLAPSLLSAPSPWASSSPWMEPGSVPDEPAQAPRWVSPLCGCVQPHPVREELDPRWWWWILQGPGGHVLLGIPGRI